MTHEDRAKLKDRINREIDIRQFLSLAPAPKGFYVCPACGSGTGIHRTGALKFFDKDNRAYCYACGKSFDVIDLYKMSNNVDFNAALNALAAQIGATATARPTRTAGTALEWNDEIGNPEPPADYKAYYEDCRNRIGDSAAAEYLRSRGIDTLTAREWNVGFDPAADPARNPGRTAPDSPTAEPRIIFPCSNSFYVARSVNQNSPVPKANGGKGVRPFNAQLFAAADDDVVFVAEGGFDALSLSEIGFKAVGMNGTGNADKVFDMLDSNPPAAVIAFAFDNDEPGRKAADHIRERAQTANFRCYVVDICGAYKDPNEALKADRQAFLQVVEAAKAEILEAAKQPTEPTKEEQPYIWPESLGDYFESGEFDNDILTMPQPIKTGFSNLDDDNAASGLYPGLYVIGAISSLGKTTFVLQMADQIAAQGKHVFMYALEQGKRELAGKVISRMTAQASADQGLPVVTAPSARKILYSREITDQTKAAQQRYISLVGKHLHVLESNMGVTIEKIESDIEKCVRLTNERPVVVVDYLQIVKEADKDKQRLDARLKVDDIIIRLKQLSKAFEVPIIAVSSVNRDAYSSPISFESFKESGAIEFTADVVWGLQLAIMDGTEDAKLWLNEGGKIEKRRKIDEAKHKTPREIELTCLKNRFGTLYKAWFEYFPAVDLYRPIPKPGKALDWGDEIGSTAQQPQEAKGNPNKEKKKRVNPKTMQRSDSGNTLLDDAEEITQEEFDEQA